MEIAILLRTPQLSSIDFLPKSHRVGSALGLTIPDVYKLFSFIYFHGQVYSTASAFTFHQQKFEPRIGEGPRWLIWLPYIGLAAYGMQSS